MNWVSVSSQLPDVGERVLFWVNGDKFYAGEYRVDATLPDEPASRTWETDGWTFEHHEVSHWARVEAP